MPAYGTIKVDTITYDLSGTATDVPVSTIAVDSDLALKADINSPTFTGSPTVPGYATLSGATFTGQINGTSLVLNNDLTVNGTLTYLNSTDLEITDKNIIIGKVSTPSDATADLGGITLKGATDKEIKWVNATDAWTFSEHINLGDDKKLLLGTGSDLEIYHDNTAQRNTLNSHQPLTTFSNGNTEIKTNNGDMMIKCQKQGSIELYENNVKKLETTSSGINVTGQINVNGSALSAAPEITLTASEAITAEDAIMVKTNGQAEKITGVISGMGSISTTFGTGPSTYDFDDHATIGYDENTDKYVCVFYNQNDSRTLYGMVGTQSGGNIVWGNASQIFTGVGDTDPPKQRIALVYVSSLQKLAYFYRNNSNNGYTRGGYLTVTGTGTSATVANLGGNTFGNPNTAAYSAAYTNSGNHGLVIAYSAVNNGKRPRIMKVNINSTSSMTDTSELDVTQINQSDYSNPDILWSASNSLYSICFKNDNGRPACKNLSYATWGVTPSGNNGTEISTDGIETECGPKIAWSSVDNKHLAIWPQYNTDKIRGVIYTASGSSISAGTTFDIAPSGVGTPRRANLYSVTYNATANRFFVTYAYRNANGTFLKVLKYNSSTNQCDIESTTTIQSSERAFFIDSCNNPDDNRIGIVYNNESGEAGRVTCYTPDNSNMDPARFVGFAKASVSSGAEVTVKVSSNTSTRSGLTPASTYYVLGDGSIGTTAAPTGTIKAGLALTSTKLLINRDNES